MGNGPSEEDRRREVEKELDEFVQYVKDGPDLTVDKTIVMFCSLECSENLKRHFEKRKSETYPTSDWIKKLVEQFAGQVLDPKLAGLGALCVTIIIDICSDSRDSTEKALQRVFADQKALEVWNLVEECLQWCRIYIDNEDKLRTNISRIERKLNGALIALKSSMLVVGQMSSQAVRAWVNGAAFHIQIMIHLVRLGGNTNCDQVVRTLAIYQEQLEQVFKKHREMIESKCQCRSDEVDPFSPIPPPRYLVDEDSVSHMFLSGGYDMYFKAYYKHRYGRQKHRIRQYFRDVEQNLQRLVRLKGSFRVE